MVEIGLVILALGVSAAGYRMVRRSKKLEEINLVLQSMSISIF